MCVYLYAILCMYFTPLKHTCWMTLWSHGMCLQLLCWNILWSYLLRPRFPMVYARVCNHHPRPSVSTQANPPWPSADSDLHWLVGRGSHCIYATEIKNPHYFRVDVRVFPLTSVSWGGGRGNDWGNPLTQNFKKSLFAMVENFKFDKSSHELERMDIDHLNGRPCLISE